MSNYCNPTKKENREKVFLKYGGKCAYCGCGLSIDAFHIDHIEPARRHMSNGNGSNSIDNYNPCCYTCNSSKSSFDLETWREELSLKVGRLNKFHSIYRIAKSFGLVAETNIPVTFYFERHG